MLAQMFACKRCGTVRQWGATDSRIEEDVRVNPLLLCATCSPKWMVPHRFSNFNHQTWGDYASDAI